MNFSDLKPGTKFTINAAIRPKTEWITATVAIQNPETILATYEKRAHNGQTEIVLNAKDWYFLNKNGDVMPLDIDPEEAIASTRATLDAAKATIERQAARITDLEAENATLRERITLLEAKKEADADAETIRRLASYQRRAEMCVWGPEDADEEGGQ